MKKNKDKLLYLSCFLLFASLLLFNPQPRASEMHEPVSRTEGIKDDDTVDSPLSADGTTGYTSNYFYIINEQFDDQTSFENDWDVNVDGDTANASIDETEGQLVMEVGQTTGSNEIVRVEYANDIPPFVNGDIEFYYNVPSGTLRFQLFNGTNWNTIDSFSEDSDSYPIDLEQEGYSDESDFGLRFEFEGRNKQEARVDNLTLGNYEFSWTELNDTIHPDDDQEMDLYLNPNFTDYMSSIDTSNVSLRYNVNDENIQNGEQIISEQTENNFTFTIPSSNYVSGDTVYYQIWIKHDSTQEIHKSTIANFTCKHVIPPNITDVGLNQTAKYYEDVAVESHIEPHENGTGLDEVEMYISYDNKEPNSSDTVIESNYTDSETDIPSEGGDFEFVIPHHNLSARIPDYYELFYTINATDGQNSALYNGNFTIGDDIEPNIKLHEIFAPDHGIENNRSLTVSYNISEPSDGSGMGISRPYIFGKVNSSPNNASDYEIFAQANNSPGYDGGIYNFTIDEGNYTYDDWVHFFVNATDNHGNTNSSYADPFPNNQSVFVNDTISPQVIQNKNNEDAANYNTSKTITFNITEPDGASGICNDSLVLKFWVNESETPHELNKSLPLSGGESNFTIGHGNYSYEDTVYYRLNVSDNANNSYSSEVKHFNVTDLIAPTTTFLKYSNDTAGIEYRDDFNITFSVYEDLDGSLFDSIELYVQNGSSGSWLNATRVYKTNSSQILGDDGEFQVYFEINSSLTSAREPLYWNITVGDEENNWNSLNDSLNIFDFDPPNIDFSGHNGTEETEFEYNEDMEITYFLSEPHGASGLHTDRSEFKLYYQIEEDLKNVSLSEGTNVPEYSGNLSFIIPRREFNWSDEVSVWLNASDLEGNINSTKDEPLNFTIIDLTPPVIELTEDVNSKEVSYHNNKTIEYFPEKDFDASELENATLYWKKGTDPSFTNYEDKLTRELSGFGYSNYSWILPEDVLNFTYGDEIYFFINIFDEAGNNQTSEVNRFNITDEVIPEFSEDLDYNERDWTWRANRDLNFTVYEPDYPNSSGIESITLYYKGGSEPTVDDYHNKTTIKGDDIDPSQGQYLIKV
ncbi:MAG: hypothetical protein R6U96_01905, partial [Promethearchaeia archaeon]